MQIHEHGPSLRFYLGAELYRRTDTLLTQLEQDDKPSKHAAAFAALVNELTDAAALGTDMVEEQIRQVSEAIAAEPGSEPAKTPRSRRPRS